MREIVHGDYIPFETIHYSKACSTLILGNFPKKYGKTGWPNFGAEHPFSVKGHEPYSNCLSTVCSVDYDEFCQDLADGVTIWHRSLIANGNSETPKRAFQVGDFSFVYASVQDEQGLVNKYLEMFGFMSTGKRVYNVKNRTTVSAWLMPVPDFMQKLDDLGVKYEWTKRAKAKGERSFINNKEPSEENSNNQTKSLMD